MGLYKPSVNQVNVESIDYDDSPLFIKITDKNGNLVNKNLFRAQTLNGQEAISQLYEFTLDLRANDTLLTENAQVINIDDILGQDVTVSYVLPKTESQSGGSDAIRFFTGIVTDFTYGVSGKYKLTLKPALWRASLTNRYQLYSTMTIKALIANILDGYRIEYQMYLDSVATEREQDWIQTGESDLNFLQRIMAKANIYFYFMHEDARHIMVIANTPQYQSSATQGRPGPLILKYTNTSQSEQLSVEDEHIHSYEYKTSLSQTGVHELLVRSEAAWEADAVAGYSKFESQQNDVYRLPFRDYRTYQYGGSRSEATVTSKKLWEMIQSGASGLSGSSSSSLLSAGHTFTTKNNSSSVNHYQFSSGYSPFLDDVRPELENQEFVVVQVQHQIGVSELYSNKFEATQSDKLITHFDMQSTQQGSILGTVVADETATNPIGWRYRYKNNFYSEPHTAKDFESGEQLREIGVFVQLVTDDFAQQGPVWIKLAQHMQTVPEVGVTVSIGRSNDESEMPEVQSIVQANGSKTIMPSGWTANTSVGSNYSTSYGDSKGIRFGAYSNANLDNAISIVEAAYATKQFKDASYSQGAGYSYSTSETGKSGLLSESESYGSTKSKFYGALTDSYSEIDKSLSTSEIGYSESHSTIGDTYSYTTISGKSFSETTIGSQESISTINGKSVSTNTFNGKTENTTTHNANIDSTTNIYGNQTSNSFTLGTSDNQSQTIGATNNMNMFIGAKNNMELNVAASNNMSINVSGSNDTTVNVGAHLITRVDAGVNIETHINATADIKEEIKVFQSKTKTTPLEVITEPANVKARIGNIDVEIMTFKIFM